VITDNNGTGVAGQVTVNEAGLAAGTLHDGSNATTGTMTVTAANGLSSIDFGATHLTLAQLNALGTTPQTIATANGAMTLTGFNAATGVISYSYAITAPQTAAGASVLDSGLTITVHDAGGFTAAATFTATILDDAPSAANDTLATTLNVVASGSLGSNDTVGADAGATWAVATGPAHGTLTITNASTGAYSYTPTAGYTGADSFTYTLTDQDGDVATASANITVAPGVDLSARWIDYWQFNEGSGTSTTNYNPATDQIGTITNNTPHTGQAADPAANLSPTWTTGRNGSAAMQFNGVGGTSAVRDGGWVALDHSVTDTLAGQTTAKAATLSVWIKTAQVGAAIGWDSPSVIGMENNGGTVDIQWGFINNQGKIGLGMGDNAGLMSNNAINDNQWHNVVISHDFSTGVTNMWVDGAAQAINGTVLSAGATAPNKFLGLGVTADDGATSDRFLNAALEDTRIYDGALTDAQAKAIYETELWGNQTAIIANDGHAIHFSLSANQANSVILSGLVVGATVADGTGAHTATVGATGTVDISTWGASEVVLSNYGTGSFHFSVTGTDISGHTDSQLLSVVNNADMYAGTAGGETLNASANNNAHVLAGGTGADTLIGGGVADVFIGGQGSDTISLNNGGVDTIRWVLSDAKGSPTDNVTNFSAAAPTTAAGGDVLDLRDLLVGELHTGGDAGNLANYLHFSSAGGNTTINITTHDATNATQTIVLQGTDLTTLGSTDNAIIQSLLNNGKLITD
jgi:hypothetical protein